MNGRTSDWPDAVLWDLDGTLIDSQPYWHAAEYALADRYGGSWSDEHSLALTGAHLIDAGRYIQQHMRIDVAPEVIVDELIELVAESLSRCVPWRPGARELLQELLDAGIPCALVTMSYRSLVVPVVSELPERAFAVVVAGDEVQNGKPHPEPYLTAAAALGLEPHRCLALEDSATGARSAAAAGCRVVVAPSHVPVDADPAWMVAGPMTDLDLPRLLAFVSA